MSVSVQSAMAKPGSASTTAQGIIELLTDAEFNTGTDSSRAVLVSNFVKSIGTAGYITLPGGLILQWALDESGTTGTTVTFPVAFTTACYLVVATCKGSGNINRTISADTPTTTTVVITRNNPGSGASAGTHFFWFAIGK